MARCPRKLVETIVKVQQHSTKHAPTAQHQVLQSMFAKELHCTETAQNGLASLCPLITPFMLSPLLYKIVQSQSFLRYGNTFSLPLSLFWLMAVNVWMDWYYYSPSLSYYSQSTFSMVWQYILLATIRFILFCLMSVFRRHYPIFFLVYIYYGNVIAINGYSIDIVLVLFCHQFHLHCLLLYSDHSQVFSGYIII